MSHETVDASQVLLQLHSEISEFSKSPTDTTTLELTRLELLCSLRHLQERGVARYRVNGEIFDVVREIDVLKRVLDVSAKTCVESASMDVRSPAKVVELHPAPVVARGPDGISKRRALVAVAVLTAVVGSAGWMYKSKVAADKPAATIQAPQSTGSEAY